MLLFWPIFVFLDLTNLETWEWPANHDLALLSLGAVMAATGNLALMAGVALLPSPLVVSIATIVQVGKALRATLNCISMFHFFCDEMMELVDACDTTYSAHVMGC